MNTPQRTTAVQKPAWRALLAVCLILLGLAGVALGAGGGFPHYKGQVLYRANKAPAAGLLVELVEADDDDQPGDEVISSTHADAQGHFSLDGDGKTRPNVALVVSAVSESAGSGGDRRSEGYNVKTKRTRLGFIANPSTTKSNTILIERRKAGGSADSD